MSWRILLVGGNSGSGKTTLTQFLVRQLGVSALMVDDIRIALQQATNPASHPELHRFLRYQPEQWLDPQGIARDWQHLGQAMMGPLREIMAHHLVVEGSGPLILEGDGILPALAQPDLFKNLPGLDPDMVKEAVKAVFLIEEDEAVILQNIRRRGRSINQTPEANQQAFARASQLYGQHLKAVGPPELFYLPARPYETAVNRLIDIIK